MRGSSSRPWQTVLAVTLALGYLVLTGEAIHCQYFLHEQAEHQHSPTPEPSKHASHCAIVSHSAVAAIDAAPVVHFNPLQLLASAIPSDPDSVRSHAFSTSTSRGPPALLPTV